MKPPKGTKCECTDPWCLGCGGKCQKQAVVILYRIDMEDRTGTALCNKCGDDAMGSGLFDVSRNFYSR